MRLSINNSPYVSKGKIEYKKVKSVLRYHVPSPHKRPEKYAHHMLFMFYPFRKESDLCSVESGTYMENIGDPVVKNVVNKNKLKFEPFAELVDVALTEYRTDLIHNPNAFSQQENNEITAMMEPETEENEAPLFQGLWKLSINLSMLISDSEITSKTRSLNTKKKEIFEVINKCARDYVKHSSHLLNKTISPLHLFITGSGGCGKSYLIKTVYNS